MTRLVKVIILSTGIVMLAGTGITAYLIFQAPPKTLAKIFLVDVTEKMLPRPEASVIKTSYGFQDQQLFIGAYFRLKTISEISYGNIFESKIDAVNPMSTNDRQRKAEINAFFWELEASIDSVNSLEMDLVRSSIYLSLIDELNFLVSYSAEEKEMFIYSDLRENSDFLNTYYGPTLRQLYNKPEAIRNLLEQKAEMPDLTGISIHIIYQPNAGNLESAKVFEQMATLYKNMIIDKGGQVFISQNN